MKSGTAKCMQPPAAETPEQRAGGEFKNQKNAMIRQPIVVGSSTAVDEAANVGWWLTNKKWVQQRLANNRRQV